MKNLQSENFQQNKLQFEKWMQGKMRSKKNTGLDRQQAIFEIPVVVHVGPQWRGGWFRNKYQ
jgi:hypothetical protein